MMRPLQLYGCFCRIESRPDLKTLTILDRDMLLDRCYRKQCCPACARQTQLLELRISSQIENRA
jgi:hypothetical protein